MVDTRRSSRPGQATFASLPTLYRRRSAGRPKRQSTPSSPTLVRTTKENSSPTSKEEATSQSRLFPPARSSKLDSNDQVDDSYEVTSKSTQRACLSDIEHAQSVITRRNDDAGICFPTTHKSGYKEKANRVPETGNHEITLPDDDTVAKPDTLFPAVPQNLTQDQLQIASSDPQISVPTKHAQDEFQGVTQGSIVSDIHSAEGCISLNANSSDDLESTTNVPTHDVMEGVQGSQQKSGSPDDQSGDSASMEDSPQDGMKSTNDHSSHDEMEGVETSEQDSELHEDYSGDSASAQDSSADDAGITDTGSTPGVTEYTGALPEPYSDYSADSPPVYDDPASEVRPSTNTGGTPDADSNVDDSPEPPDEPATPQTNPTLLANDSSADGIELLDGPSAYDFADGTEFLDPSAYSDDDAPPLIDPAIEARQQTLYERILCNVWSRSAYLFVENMLKPRAPGDYDAPVDETILPYIFGHLKRKYATEYVDTTPLPSPYPTLKNRWRFENFTPYLGTNALGLMNRRLAMMNLQVQAQAPLPGRKVTRFDAIEEPVSSARRMLIFDPMVPSNLAYERGDARRAEWRAAMMGNPDF